MITAKNYAAQAERGLLEYADRVLALSGSKYAEHDAKVLLSASMLLKDAIKFAIPDYGVIFDDKLKGLSEQILRLPFKNISIEFFTPKPEHIEEGRQYAAKHILLVEEFTQKELFSHLPSDSEQFKIKMNDEHYISVTSILCIEGTWLVNTFGLIMPSQWDKSSGSYTFTNHSLIHLEEMIKIQGQEKAINCLQGEVISEVVSLLEFLEALSCSNVRHERMEKIDQSINARRIRDGKLPIYETHILTIDAGKTSSIPKTGTEGYHNSPRQHLRRGHIRKLSSGNKIWINACTVGKAENGIIEKSYRIENSSGITNNE